MQFELLKEADYDRATDDCVLKIVDNPGRLYIGGALCLGTLMDPEEFDSTLVQISDIFSDAYQKKLDITALRQERTDEKSLNYATIYGQKRKALLLLTSFEDISEPVQVTDSGILHGYIHFSSYFPLDDLRENTIAAVQQFWPFVQAIKHTKAKKGPAFGEGNIELTPKAEIIATGYPALEQLGLTLQKKQFFKEIM